MKCKLPLENDVNTAVTILSSQPGQTQDIDTGPINSRPDRYFATHDKAFVYEPLVFGYTLSLTYITLQW